MTGYPVHPRYPHRDSRDRESKEQTVYLHLVLTEKKIPVLCLTKHEPSPRSLVTRTLGTTIRPFGGTPTLLSYLPSRVRLHRFRPSPTYEEVRSNNKRSKTQVDLVDSGLRILGTFRKVLVAQENGRRWESVKRHLFVVVFRRGHTLILCRCLKENRSDH